MMLLGFGSGLVDTGAMEANFTPNDIENCVYEVRPAATDLENRNLSMLEADERITIDVRHDTLNSK